MKSEPNAYALKYVSRIRKAKNTGELTALVDKIYEDGFSDGQNEAEAVTHAQTVIKSHVCKMIFELEKDEREKQLELMQALRDEEYEVNSYSTPYSFIIEANKQ